MLVGEYHGEKAKWEHGLLPSGYMGPCNEDNEGESDNQESDGCIHATFVEYDEFTIAVS